MKAGAWWIAGLGLALSSCVSPNEERVRDYNQDGVYLYERGNYRDASESFRAALTLRPEDPGLYYNLAECYNHLGNAAQAEHYYQECIKREPNHVACRHALVVLLVNGNRRPEAVRLVEDWLTHEPRLAAAYAEDGWLAHQAGDLPRAQARLQQALGFDPHDARALTELALVYEAMNRPDRALVLYERVLERDAGQAEVTRRVNFLLAKGVRAPRPE
jgi:tetratricopeptide (TPR) repeat protein